MYKSVLTGPGPILIKYANYLFTNYAHLATYEMFYILDVRLTNDEINIINMSRDFLYTIYIYFF